MQKGGLLDIVRQAIGHGELGAQRRHRRGERRIGARRPFGAFGAFGGIEFTHRQLSQVFPERHHYPLIMESDLSLNTAQDVLKFL